MKVAIVGFDQDAVDHLRCAGSFPGIKITGVVSEDEKTTRQVADKYQVENYFPTIDDLFQRCKPDVIHIVSSLSSHFSLVRKAIENKCHVLVESPFGLNLEELQTLFELAEANGVELCPLHSYPFDPCMMEAFNLVKEGKVGQVVKIEGHCWIDTRIDVFRKYPAPNVLPWIYSMPGGVFQAYMAHPLSVMLPFLGKIEKIEVAEKSSGELPQNLSDELNLSILGKKTSGSMTISLAAKPGQNKFCIYGTEMNVSVDFDTMTTTRFSGDNFAQRNQKKFGVNADLLLGKCSDLLSCFRKRNPHFRGMKTLIHQFYDAVAGKCELPVSREDTLALVEAMDVIWPQVKQRQLSFDPILPFGEKGKEEQCKRVLVTGGTGFLGKRLVHALIRKGFTVRVLARKLSRIEPLLDSGVEIFFGDVADAVSMGQAFKDVDYVVHAAAHTGSNGEEGCLSTVTGTQNILDLCEQENVTKLVYISSCSVYGVYDCHEGQLVAEDASLERYPEKRGSYSQTKIEAERLVVRAMEEKKIPLVCLRPGTIFGPGGHIFTPMMGFSLGAKIFTVIGNGNFVLPLVYVDNLASAIVAALENERSTGRIYNVVDPERVTKKAYMEHLVIKIFPTAKTIYFPYSFLNFAVYFQEKCFNAIKRSPFLTRYRLISSQKPIMYDGTKIMDDLGWKPAVSMTQAFETIIRYESEKG